VISSSAAAWVSSARRSFHAWETGPLFAYARCGRDGHEARDLVQGYCAWAIETDLVGRFDPARGRLRSWLLLWFQGYLRDEAERAGALKRGGGVTTEAVDEVEVAARGLSPEEAYDRAWAQALVARAFARLKVALAVDPRIRWKLALVQLIEVDGYGRLPCVEKYAKQNGVTEEQVRHFLEDSKPILKGEITREVRESCASLDDTRAERDYLLRCLGPR